MKARRYQIQLLAIQETNVKKVKIINFDEYSLQLVEKQGEME